MPPALRQRAPGRGWPGAGWTWAGPGQHPPGLRWDCPCRLLEQAQPLPALTLPPTSLSFTMGATSPVPQPTSTLVTGPFPEPGWRSSAQSELPPCGAHSHRQGARGSGDAATRSATGEPGTQAAAWVCAPWQAPCLREAPGQKPSSLWEPGSGAAPSGQVCQAQQPALRPGMGSRSPARTPGLEGQAACGAWRSPGSQGGQRGVSARVHGANARPG